MAFKFTCEKRELILFISGRSWRLHEEEEEKKRVCAQRCSWQRGVQLLFCTRAQAQTSKPHSCCLAQGDLLYIAFVCCAVLRADCAVFLCGWRCIYFHTILHMWTHVSPTTLECGFTDWIWMCLQCVLVVFTSIFRPVHLWADHPESLLQNMHILFSTLYN